MHKLTLKINKDLGCYMAGAEVIAVCDENGTPLSALLRRALEDAKIDNCIEIMKTKPKQKPATKPHDQPSAQEKPNQQKEDDK